MLRYARFAEFYPFYLSEHAHRTTRRLHFLGSSLGLLCLILVYAACWSEAYISRGLFLAAIAYCVPGAILFFFAASLYFARWLFLSGGAGAKGAP